MLANGENIQLKTNLDTGAVADLTEFYGMCSFYGDERRSVRGKRARLSLVLSVVDLIPLGEVSIYPLASDGKAVLVRRT